MKNSIEFISRRGFLTLLAASGFALKASGSDGELEKYYNTAISKLAGREVEGADMLSSIEGRFPSSAMAWFIAGNTVLMDQRKDPDEKQRTALARYSRALQLDKNLAGAYVNRGAMRSYMALPGKEEAMGLARRVIRGDTAGKLEAGASRLRALEESVADFKKAIEINPKLFAAHYDMGFFLASCYKWEEAIPEFSKAIEIGSRNSDWSIYTPTFKDEGITEVIMDPSHFCMVGGILKLVKDRFGTFRVGADRLVVLDSKDILGSAYLQNEDEALAFAYFKRGMAYMGLASRGYENADADLQKAISLNPNVPIFYQTLNILQGFRGQTAEAAETMKKHGMVLTKLQRCIDQLTR